MLFLRIDSLLKLFLKQNADDSSMSTCIVVLVWVPFEDLNACYKTMSMMFLGIMFENTAYIL